MHLWQEWTKSFHAGHLALTLTTSLWHVSAPSYTQLHRWCATIKKMIVDQSTIVRLNYQPLSLITPPFTVINCFPVNDKLYGTQV